MEMPACVLFVCQSAALLIVHCVQAASPDGGEASPGQAWLGDVLMALLQRAEAHGLAAFAAERAPFTPGSAPPEAQVQACALLA